MFSNRTLATAQAALFCNCCSLLSCARLHLPRTILQYRICGLCDFQYILKNFHSEYKRIPWSIHCCHGNTIVEEYLVNFWLKSVENCTFFGSDCYKEYPVFLLIKECKCVLSKSWMICDQHAHPISGLHLILFPSIFCGIFSSYDSTFDPDAHQIVEIA